MKLAFYIIFRGAYIRGGGLYSDGEFVLVSRGAYIRGGGVYSGGAYIQDFTVFELSKSNHLISYIYAKNYSNLGMYKFKNCFFCTWKGDIQFRNEINIPAQYSKVEV